MKKILSFLLTIVFLQAQVFAMSGGPNLGGAKGENIVGTYSGTLTPDAIASSVLGPNGEQIPSLGIFSIKVPVTGYATGVFTMFSEGQVFGGTISAVGDALKGTLSGLLQATYDVTITASILDTIFGPVVSSTGVTYTVNGTLKAEVSTAQGQSTSTSATGNSFQLVTGQAILVVSQGQVNAQNQPIITSLQTYTVDGVKQSSALDAATTN